jgi:hypothetical protein
MNTQEKFYIYEHVRPDTGAVFYVGKGCRERANVSVGRSKHWKNVVDKAGGREVRFLAKNLDEELAFLCEIEAIDKYRRLGVKLVNLADGGGGSTGYTFAMSDEHKQKIAQAKTGVPRPPEVVKKMRQTKTGKLTGADNPFFGKHHSEETKEVLRIKSGSRKHTEEVKQKITATLLENAKTSKLSKPVLCLTNGKTYFSIREAARQLQLNNQCISLCCHGKIHHTAGYKFEWSNK